MPKKTEPTSELLEGLKWISHVKAEHCILDGQYIRATDGLITMGYPCQEHFGQAPSLAHLLAAIKVCGNKYRIVEEAFKLTITAFNFKAIIVSIDAINLPAMIIAPMMAKISHGFVKAAQIAGKFSSEGASRLLEASLYCKAGSVIGTDGKVLIEAWHGIDMPEIILPCAAVNTLAKIHGELIGFGVNYNHTCINAMTFWFANGAWMTAQLYVNETWPTMKMDEILNVNSTAGIKFPSTFFLTLNAIKPFVIEKGTVPGIILLSDRCKSHDEPNVGAEMQWNEDMQLTKFKCNINSLLGLSGHVHSFVHVEHDNRMVLIGNNVRAAIMGLR